MSFVKSVIPSAYFAKKNALQQVSIVANEKFQKDFSRERIIEKITEKSNFGEFNYTFSSYHVNEEIAKELISLLDDTIFLLGNLGYKVSVKHENGNYWHNSVHMIVDWRCE